MTLQKLCAAPKLIFNQIFPATQAAISLTTDMKTHNIKDIKLKVNFKILPTHRVLKIV